MGVSTSNVFRKGMAAAEGLEDLRGRGALELNSQQCDETQREIDERDRIRIQNRQKEKPTNKLQSPEL